LESFFETKDGTVSVATAFAGHQEGNASATHLHFTAMILIRSI